MSTLYTVDLEIFVLGNFRMINFLCRKFFVGTTSYHVNINSAHVFFIRLIFLAAIDYKNIFTTKISRFTALLLCMYTIA